MAWKIAPVFKVLLASITLSYLVSGSVITTECVGMGTCSVTNGSSLSGIINCGEGHNITLNFTYSKLNTFTVQLMYDNILAPTLVYAVQTTLSLGTNSLFDLSETGLLCDVDKCSFSIKVISLNRAIHTGKMLYVVHTAPGNLKTTISLLINVQYGPEQIGQWILNPTANENENMKMNWTLSGNPRPDVTANIGSHNFSVVSLNHPTLQDTYVYSVTLQNVNKDKCGKTVTLSANGYTGTPLNVSAKLNISFTPATPVITSANYNLSNYLVVTWNKIESGDCVVSYTLTYKYLNYAGANNYSDHTAVIHDTTLYEKHFSFNTSYNGTVSLQATVGMRSSSFSSPIMVAEVEETNVLSTAATASTTVPAPPTVGRQTGEDKPKSLEWYIILIIVIAVLLVIILILIIFLVMTNRCKCCRRPSSKTKPASVKIDVPNGNVTIKNGSLDRGVTNPRFEMSSVDELQRCMTLTKEEGKEKEPENTYASISVDPKTKDDGKGKKHDYAEIGNEKDKEKVDYATVNKNEKPTSEPGNPNYYAELGRPGGRVGEKPKVQPSIYAQVNTDQAYYPPLNPDTRNPPLYATPSREKSLPGRKDPVSKQSSQDQMVRPESDLEDDGFTVSHI